MPEHAVLAAVHVSKRRLYQARSLPAPTEMAEFMSVHADMCKLAEAWQKLADECAVELLPMWKPRQSKLNRAIVRAKKRARKGRRAASSSTTSSYESDGEGAATTAGQAGGSPPPTGSHDGPDAASASKAQPK